MSALKVAVTLAEAYQAAPVNWLRGYGRIDNTVRISMREVARSARKSLEAIPEADRPATYYGAEQAVVEMYRVASGTDPRGGTERDQMVTAMSNVAREMARSLTWPSPT